jgi:hypothetical protein
MTDTVIEKKYFSAINRSSIGEAGITMNISFTLYNSELFNLHEKYKPINF